MADQIRDIYRVANFNAIELNRVLQRIGDRLDQMQGQRGDPNFYSETFKFPSGKLVVGSVLKATGTSEVKPTTLEISDISGATSGSFLQGDTDGTVTEKTPTETVEDLGLVIGTDVQAYDADLTTWAGISPSSNVQSFCAAANYSAMRSALGVAIGSDVQAWAQILDDFTANRINGATLIDIYDIDGELIHQYPLEWMMYSSVVFRVVGEDLDLTPEA